MATVSTFSCGITPRGFVLVEHRGRVSRPVTEPEPSQIPVVFLQLQLRTASDERVNAFLRAEGCTPIDYLPNARFRGVIA